MQEAVSTVGVPGPPGPSQALPGPPRPPGPAGSPTPPHPPSTRPGRLSGYLGLAVRQEEVGSTLILGRAGAVDEDLHLHLLFLLLVHPSDALPRNTALTPGPTPARQVSPGEGMD